MSNTKGMDGENLEMNERIEGLLYFCQRRSRSFEAVSLHKLQEDRLFLKRYIESRFNLGA